MIPLRPHQRNHFKTTTSDLDPSREVRTVEIFKAATKIALWRPHHLHKIVINRLDPSKVTRVVEVFMKPKVSMKEKSIIEWRLQLRRAKIMMMTIRLPQQ
jgi:hypothetical protein